MTRASTSPAPAATNGDRPTLLLLDGHSLAFRAFYALPAENFKTQSGLTTNAVAEVSGVSIGSLYQYFPNKQALVAALIERRLDDKNARTREELSRVAHLPLHHGVRTMIALTIETYSESPELSRVLIQQVPRVGRLARIAELHAGTLAVITAVVWLRTRRVGPLRTEEDPARTPVFEQG